MEQTKIDLILGFNVGEYLNWHEQLYIEQLPFDVRNIENIPKPVINQFKIGGFSIETIFQNKYIIDKSMYEKKRAKAQILRDLKGDLENLIKYDSFKLLEKQYHDKNLELFYMEEFKDDLDIWASKLDIELIKKYTQWAYLPNISDIETLNYIALQFALSDNIRFHLEEKNQLAPSVSEPEQSKIQKIVRGEVLNARQKVEILKQFGVFENELFNCLQVGEKERLLSQLFGGDNPDNIGNYINDATRKKKMNGLEFKEKYAQFMSKKPKL